MSAQNPSLKKNQKNHFQKSKTNKLLLTNFNKLSLFNINLLSSKKKLLINNQTYSNNSFKNQKVSKNINTLNNIKKNNNIQKNNFTNSNDIKSKMKNGNGSKNEYNQIIYNNIINSNSLNNFNKFNKQINKSFKCNSVNNLIGININVNYMNKNYAVNKIKPNFYMPNYSTKNFQNNNCKINNNININDNYYNKFISESFNEINKGNISSHNSSRKNKINKKKKIIISPLQNEYQKILENIKYNKEINSTKNKNNNLNKKKFHLEIKNSINSIYDNNNHLSDNINKTNYNKQKKIIEIGKSSSCKNLNTNIYNDKNTQNIYKILTQSMDEKINKLKINNNHFDEDKLYDIVNEFFIKYCNILDDQSQKELIVNIFYQMNDIINKKDKKILIIQKEKDNLLQNSKNIKNNYDELIKENNSLINKYNILQNKLDELNSEGKIHSNDKKNKENDNSLNKIDNPALSNSSYVNTEELESIRFFDKIKMKKHSFSNIPELSFQKLKIDKIKNEVKVIKKKRINQFSFQENNKFMKKIKNNKSNSKEINKKKKNYNNSNIMPKCKQKLNISYKHNNSSVNKGSEIININRQNDRNFIIPDFKKNIIQKNRKLK